MRYGANFAFGQGRWSDDRRPTVADDRSNSLRPSAYRPPRNITNTPPSAIRGRHGPSRIAAGKRGTRATHAPHHQLTQAAPIYSPLEDPASIAASRSRSASVSEPISRATAASVSLNSSPLPPCLSGPSPTGPPFTFSASLVQAAVQAAGSVDVSRLSASLRSPTPPLPKLDVEGSSPFARSFRPRCSGIAHSGSSDAFYRCISAVSSCLHQGNNRCTPLSGPPWYDRTTTKVGRR
jgi:hypothetical protein